MKLKAYTGVEALILANAEKAYFVNSIPTFESLFIGTKKLNGEIQTKEKKTALWST